MFHTAAIAVAGYAGLLGLTRAFYRSVLYPAPRRGLTADPAGGRLEAHPTPDGQRVQCARYDGGPQTIVFFHGNGESIADSVALGRAMAARGVSFVAVEYRGYGASPAASPSEQGLYADAMGVLDALAARGVGREALTLWGSSLGTGVAMEMAVRDRAARLVLQAPYTAIPDVAQRLLPILPMRLALGDHFDNLRKAPRVTQPTLVIHGDADGVVPYDMGVTLAGAIAGATLLTIPGGGHNDLFARDRERLLAAIVAHARA